MFDTDETSQDAIYAPLEELNMTDPIPESLTTDKITQIEIADGWHKVVGKLSLSFVWLTTEVSVIVFICADDQGRSLIGGSTKIRSARADGMDEQAALAIVERGVRQLLANPPPYRDTPLARQVREHPDAQLLVNLADRHDHRQN